MQQRKITFIGAGNMAHAIITGLISAGYPANYITACSPTATNRDLLVKKYGINGKSDNSDASKHADVIILAVKPQIMETVCQPLKEQVNFANGFKVDVIITDHHEAPDELPNAFAIINPKAINSLKKELELEEIEALNQLAGVGVAFKLACALLEVKEDFDIHFITKKDDVSKICIVGPMMLSNKEAISKIFKIASDENIQIYMISLSELAINIIVDTSKSQFFMQKLHEILIEKRNN